MVADGSGDRRPLVRPRGARPDGEAHAFRRPTPPRVRRQSRFEASTLTALRAAGRHGLDSCQLAERVGTAPGELDALLEELAGRGLARMAAPPTWRPARWIAISPDGPAAAPAEPPALREQLLAAVHRYAEARLVDWLWRELVPEVSRLPEHLLELHVLGPIEARLILGGAPGRPPGRERAEDLALVETLRQGPLGEREIAALSLRLARRAGRAEVVGLLRRVRALRQRVPAASLASTAYPGPSPAAPAARLIDLTAVEVVEVREHEHDQPDPSEPSGPRAQRGTRTRAEPPGRRRHPGTRFTAVRGAGLPAPGRSGASTGRLAPLLNAALLLDARTRLRRAADLHRRGRWR